jgi:hypothetical protein
MIRGERRDSAAATRAVRWSMLYLSYISEMLKYGIVGQSYAMAARTPYLPAAAALRICSVRLVFRDAIFAV